MFGVFNGLEEDREREESWFNFCVFIKFVFTCCVLIIFCVILGLFCVVVMLFCLFIAVLVFVCLIGDFLVSVLFVLVNCVIFGLSESELTVFIVGSASAADDVDAATAAATDRTSPAASFVLFGFWILVSSAYFCLTIR